MRAGRSAAASRVTARPISGAGGAISWLAIRPVRGVAGSGLGGRRCLHFVRQNQVGDAAFHFSMLDRERHQLAGVATGDCGLPSGAHGIERGVQVYLLKGAGTEYLRCHLTTQC